MLLVVIIFFLLCFKFQALIAKSDTLIWLDASSRFYPTVNFEEFFQKLDNKGLMFDIRSSGGSVSTRSHETMLKVWYIILYPCSPSDETLNRGLLVLLLLRQYEFPFWDICSAIFIFITQTVKEGPR